MKANYTPAEVGPLIGLEQIKDPRYQPFVSHTLPEVLFLVISASLSYCNHATEMETFGNAKLPWLRKYFAYANGIPSHDTICRLLGMIDREAFAEWFSQWVRATFLLTEDEQIAFDGKRLVGSANKADQSKSKADGGQFAKIIVNVFATRTGLVLAHKDVSCKTDELDGARQLIRNLEVEGCTISGDNNFCSRDFLKLIIAKKADYLITLKGKSPKLHNAAKAAFSDEEVPKQVYVTTETGHGRHEKRTYRSVPVASLPEAVTTTYCKLAQIVEVQRERTVKSGAKKQQKVYTHYYITSKTNELSKLAQGIRSHWAIENNLHWVLDVGFNEDASRATKGNLAANFSLTRKFAYNLIQKMEGKGIKHRRMRAMLSDEYRDTAFTNPMR